MFFVLERILYGDDNVERWDRIGDPEITLDHAREYAKKMAQATSNKYMVVQEQYTVEGVVTEVITLKETGYTL